MTVSAPSPATPVRRLTAGERQAISDIEEAFIVTRHALRRLRPSDPELSENALALLCAVHRQPDMRVGDLAAAFGLAVSTVSRQLEPLVRRGWLVATPDPADQRVHRLTVTPAGTAALTAEEERKISRAAELLEGPVRDRLPELADLLREFAAALHTAAAPTPAAAKP